MTWLINLIKSVVDGKAAETSSPVSVRVARYTTIAAAIGAAATIFPVIWGTPPWWVDHPANRAKSTESHAETLSLAAAPEESWLDNLPWFAPVLLGVIALSVAVEVLVRYLGRKAKQEKA